MFSHRSDDFEAGYLTHLDELRNRLLYSLAAVVAGMVIAWFFVGPVYNFISVVDQVKEMGWQIISLHPAEFFATRMKIAGVLGLVLASPFVFWQLWAFIRPGLTARERRVAGPILPAVAALFLFGAAVAWLMLPKVMAFFLGYSHVFGIDQPTMSFEQTITFPLNIMLAFGISFQLPVVLLALVWLRVLTAQTLFARWRTAVVALAVLAAVITPTGDPLTMICMLVPLLFLYFGTVWFALRIQRSSKNSETAEVGR